MYSSLRLLSQLLEFHLSHNHRDSRILFQLCFRCSLCERTSWILRHSEVSGVREIHPIWFPQSLLSLLIPPCCSLLWLSGLRLRMLLHMLEIMIKRYQNNFHNVLRKFLFYSIFFNSSDKSNPKIFFTCSWQWSAISFSPFAFIMDNAVKMVFLASMSFSK